jgi:hypothetical protein
MIEVYPQRADPGWDDYTINGLDINIRGANPPDFEVFRDSIQGNAFIGTGVTVEQGFGSIHILHDYKAGTDIYPHVHWSHKIGSPSGDVVWQMAYTLARGFSQGVYPTETTITFTETAGPQYTHQIIESAAVIPAGNIEPDTLIKFRIFRDPAHANDTFENDAFLDQIDFHYESDGRRTNEKEAPFTKR